MNGDEHRVIVAAVASGWASWLCKYRYCGSLVPGQGALGRRGHRGMPSARLGPSLKDHVKWPRRRSTNLRKPTVADDLSELGLTRLRTQAFADFLVQ
jgi:hypothetical protein